MNNDGGERLGFQKLNAHVTAFSEHQCLRLHLHSSELHVGNLVTTQLCFSPAELICTFVFLYHYPRYLEQVQNCNLDAKLYIIR